MSKSLYRLDRRHEFKKERKRRKYKRKFVPTNVNRFNLERNIVISTFETDSTFEEECCLYSMSNLFQKLLKNLVEFYY